MIRHIYRLLIFLNLIIVGIGCTKNEGEIGPDNPSRQLFDFPEKITVYSIQPSTDTLLERIYDFETINIDSVNIYKYSIFSNSAYVDSQLVQLKFRAGKIQRLAISSCKYGGCGNIAPDANDIFIFYYSGDLLDSVKTSINFGNQRFIYVEHDQNNISKIQYNSFFGDWQGSSESMERYGFALNSIGLADSIYCLDAYHYTSGFPPSSLCFKSFKNIDYAQVDYFKDWPLEFKVLISDFDYQLFNNRVFRFNFFSHSIVSRETDLLTENFLYSKRNDTLSIKELFTAGTNRFEYLIEIIE